MRKLIVIFSLFLSLQMFGQFKFRKPSEYERVYVEAGMWQPLDNLSETVNPSVNFGFWFRTKMNEKEMIEVGFNLTVPDSRKSFQYEREDMLLTSRAKICIGMVGLRYSRSYPLFGSDKTNVEIFPSLGYAFFGHRAMDASGLEHNKSRMLSTVHVGQGVRLNYKNVGFQVQYQFTPYALYPRIAKDFGSQSLTFGIVYRQ